MIVILGGTIDARELFFRLREVGFPIVISVASQYASSLLGGPAAHVQRGRLDSQGMVDLLKEKRARVLIDATHPFAVEASRSAMDAARKAQVPYIRLERKREKIPAHHLVKAVDKLAELLYYVPAGEVVFSTLGSKHLEELLPLLRQKDARLVARVLPLASVVDKCTRLGLAPKDIVAMQGPFTRELNRELYRHYGAKLVLTKESGKEGGQEAKVQAALDLEVEVVVWRRARFNYPLCFSSVEEICCYMTNNM